MKNSRLFRKPHNNQICYIFYIALLWSKDLLCRYLWALFTTFPLVGQYADFGINVLFFASFALALRTLCHRLMAKDVLIFTTMMVTFAWSYIFYKSSYEYYVELGQLIATSVIPMFLIGATLYHERDDRLFNAMYGVSVATVIVFSLYTLTVEVASDLALRAGNMDSAYKLLPHVCLIFGYIVKKATIFNISVFVLGVFMSFAMGTRGAILCLGVCIILTLLFVRNFKHPFLFFISAITFVVLLVYGGIFDLLYSFAEQNGLSLRIFDKLKGGEITASSGRDMITERVWTYIFVFPIGGAGLFADRVSTGGLYAHSFHLEILIEFGIFIGTLIIATVVILFLRAFLAMRKLQDPSAFSLFLALFCSHFVKLFLSGSYLTEGGFFLLIGLSLSIVRYYRQNAEYAKPMLQAYNAEESPTDSVDGGCCV